MQLSQGANVKTVMVDQGRHGTRVGYAKQLEMVGMTGRRVRGNNYEGAENILTARAVLRP
jgi:hypothetical protein